MSISQFSTMLQTHILLLLSPIFLHLEPSKVFSCITSLQKRVSKSHCIFSGILFHHFCIKSYKRVSDEGEDDIPDEITRLLEQEEKAIQPHQEEIELINLGTEDNKREIKVGAALEEGFKKEDLPTSPRVFRYFRMVI